MAEFVHPTKYRHYIKKYSDGQAAATDIESTYNARYMKFVDFNIDGDVQNIYEETFVERSGSNVFIPSKDDLAFGTYTCKLTLLFRGDNVLTNVRNFTEAYQGVKIEYSDTFRNRYATLLMIEKPQVEQERLYGDKYQVVTFTFKNILGKTFSTSQIQ